LLVRLQNFPPPVPVAAREPPGRDACDLSKNKGACERGQPGKASKTGQRAIQLGFHSAWSIEKRVISEELSEYPTGAIARADGHSVPYYSTGITIGRSSKSEAYWEKSLDE